MMYTGIGERPVFCIGPWWLRLTVYNNGKVKIHIGSLMIELGWYSGEAPCIGVKVFEWFPHAGEIVMVYTQVVKAVLCVSWDYGRR